MEIRKLPLHVYMFWSVGTHVTRVLHMRRVTHETFTFLHLSHNSYWSLSKCAGEQQGGGGNIYHPNKHNTSGASNPTGTNRWAEHESGAFISPLFSPTYSEVDLNVGGTRQRSKRIKASGLRQQEHGRLHSLTWWGCLVDGAATPKLLPLSSVSNVGLKPAGKKGCVLAAREKLRGERGWPAAGANSALRVSALSVLLMRILLIAEDCKAMGPVPGHSGDLVTYS